MTTLQELATKALDRGPDYFAVEWSGTSYSWDDLHRTAQQVRALIEATGADPKAAVGILPSNRPAMMAALMALFSTGRSITMIHIVQSQRAIAEDLGKLKPAVVIGMSEQMGPEVLDKARQLGIAGIVLDGMDATAVPGAERSNIASGLLPLPLVDVLTSGTTGPPKRFPISYEIIMRDMVAVNSFAVSQTDQANSLPPVFCYMNCGTISGIYLNVPVLINGRRGILVDRFTVDTFHAYVRDHRPEMTGVPMPALQMLLESDIPPEDLASLKAVTTGAAPVDPAIHRAFEEKFGIVVLLVYGATEFGGPVAMMTLDLYAQWGKDKKFGSLGRPFNGANLRITHVQTGAELPRGSEGRIEVRTARIGPDWIRTSDLGVIDEDEFLWFRGRVDGAINRGGFKIMPEEIEAALRKHPAVAFASVVGVVDQRLGQVPGAAIQLRPGVPAPSVQELSEHVRQLLEKTHVPALWRFVDALPYNSTMKVDQRQVRGLFT